MKRPSIMTGKNVDLSFFILQQVMSGHLFASYFLLCHSDRVETSPTNSKINKDKINEKAIGRTSVPMKSPS
jgi:hypothetical protein